MAPIVSLLNGPLHDPSLSPGPNPVKGSIFALDLGIYHIQIFIQGHAPCRYPIVGHHASEIGRTSLAGVAAPASG
jgi:hypothetical protein